MKDLMIASHQAPGIAVLDNFDEIKAYLETGLRRYTNTVYTEESLALAKTDKKQLAELKRKLEDKPKEIKRIYMAPYQQIEAQIKELISLIDEPLEAIDTFVKQAELDEKQKQRLTIRGFFDQIAAPVGSLADALFDSPAFYDSRWENKSTSVKSWQDDMTAKVRQAAQDIRTIQAAGGRHTTSLIACYIETLDMEGTVQYKKALEAAEQMTETTVTGIEPEDKVVGYKVLKISGTRQQMTQLMDQLRLMGMDYEEIEDGMPGELTELTVPDFDSFVAFDIETTGSAGTAGGDAPAEITEIGAVKVIDGQIVDRQDWLCNPGRKIMPMISRLTHITDDMVADQPSITEIIRLFKDLVGDLPLVGHNIRSSDLHYIVKAANKAGVALENSFLDTYQLAKKLKAKYHWENVKLEYLAEQFGIEQNSAHRAWCDAEANVGVYFRLKELLGV